MADEKMMFATWVNAVEHNVRVMSRSSRGVGNTSSSVQKPALMMTGSGLATQVRHNTHLALQAAWQAKDVLGSPATQGANHLPEFVRRVIQTINRDIVPDTSSFLRTWDVNYPGPCAASEVAAGYQRMLDWLGRMLRESPDPVATAAMLEHIIEQELHPFADGCGRGARILGAWVLLRKGLMPPRLTTREDAYSAMRTSLVAWTRYYRLCMPA